VLALIAERGASFRLLREAWADTTTSAGRFLITILGGISEFWRSRKFQRSTAFIH
jgi:DNA invertase Pin-like site-specific DNA recombinase